MADKPRIKIALPTFVFFGLLAAAGSGVLHLLPFLAALLHETGHIAVMLACGQGVNRITVLPFGIDIKKAPCLSSYKTDIAVSSAGVVVNILMIGLCVFLPETPAVTYFAQSNLVLIAINILPIKTLDGGQILEKTLLLKLSPDTAEKIVDLCSMVCILLAGAVAVWLLLRSGYNFTLLVMCMYLFSGIFLKKTE